MKINTLQTYSSIKIILTILLLSVTIACKEKSSDTEILDREKFTEIITELHHADGVLFASKLSERTEKEEISMYNYVFKKHNVSRTQFYNTLTYYTKHNDEYLEVYDQVIENLERKYKISKSVIKAKSERDYDPTNLWPKKTSYSLPESGLKNPVPFKILTNDQGTYRLSADIMVYEDDASSDLRITIMAVYEDNSENMNSTGIFLKDEKFHHYETYIVTDQNKRLTEIKGWIVDHSDKTESKHIDIKNIKLKLQTENVTNNEKTVK